MNTDLDKVDRELFFLNKKIRFSLVNPINVEQEKKKVMNDRTYDVKPKYKSLPSNFPYVKKRLINLKTDDSIFGKLLNQKRNEFLKMIFMLENIGKDKFTQCSLNLYGRPGKELVIKARQLLDLEQEKTNANYSGISAVKKFLDSLLCHGLNWKVKEKEMVVGASFDVGAKVLFINPKRRFSDSDLRRLIVHEIGTHIIRAENAKQKKHKLFAIGFPGYLTTEEGLAAYNEERAGLLSNDILRTYAGRVIAIDLALQSSFSSVYNSLLEFFTKEEAFTLAMRVKRGFCDTSKAGSFTKDYFYLKGYYDVKDYIQRKGSLAQLYVGKVGMQHVPFLKYLN